MSASRRGERLPLTDGESAVEMFQPKDDVMFPNRDNANLNYSNIFDSRYSVVLKQIHKFTANQRMF